MVLTYLVRSLDACEAREKDMLHLGQWALVPQEAKFWGNGQDVTLQPCACVVP